MLIPEGDGQGHFPHAEDRDHEKLARQTEGLGKAFIHVTDHIATDVRGLVMDGHDARGIGREHLGVDAGGRPFRDGDRHGLALSLGRAVLHHGIG